MGGEAFSVLEKHLGADEKILVCFIGLHNRTSPTKNDGFYAYGLTNQRFIMGQKKMIGDDFKVIPLANMQGLRLLKETSLDLLEITSLEGAIKIVLTEEEAPKILAKLEDTIQQITKENNTEDSLSKAEQLLKMKELLRSRNLDGRRICQDQKRYSQIKNLSKNNSWTDFLLDSCLTRFPCTNTDSFFNRINENFSCSTFFRLTRF